MEGEGGAQQGLHQGAVEAGGGEQALDHRRPPGAELAGPIDLVGLEDPAHQAETIAVHAAAGDGNDLIAGDHSAAIDQGVFLDDRHTEAGQVVATGAIEAGHFGSFAAEQGAAALAAAIGNPLDNGRHGLRAELAGGQVIEKEEGLGAAGDHVVDAHGHQVDADTVVAAVGLGQFELGAHPIGARHQQGLAQARRQSAQAAEAAQAAQNLGPTGGINAGADAFDKGPSRHHVHAGCAVVHSRAAVAPILQRRAAPWGPGSDHRPPGRWTAGRLAPFTISLAYGRDRTC